MAREISSEVKINRARWLDALRNGGYAQGQGYLCQVTQGDKLYCCLGVMCHLEGKYEFVPDSIVDGNSKPMHYGRSTAFPSTATLRRFGLSFNQANHLATLNDDGVDFRKIADVAEGFFNGTLRMYRYECVPVKQRV